MYLARSVEQKTAEKVKQLKIPGLFLQQEFKRFYPHGEVTSHVIGFNNIDDHGQEGIELLFNDWLQGTTGKRKVHKNLKGEVIDDLGIVEESRPGKDIKLSIDLRLQNIAYQALKEAIEEYQLVSGSIVMLDANTGEVLAMVNAPFFNPNKKISSLYGQQRNRAVTDLFELGSVMKPFVVASALESGKFTGDTEINTHPGWMVVGGKTINDVNNYGNLTVKNILKKSSNVGIIKILQEIEPANYIKLLRAIGLGELTNINLPGERAGYVLEQDNFNHTLAALGMGYSISMTTLQLARAFSIFAGDGKLRNISILPIISQVSTQEQVISPSTSKQVQELLEVNNVGTTKRAFVPGYKFAAKTGTARLVSDNGYDAKRHLASVIGIGPLEKPKIILAIVLNDPKGSLYYGGLIAAPVFAKIAAASMRTLNIPHNNG